MREKPYLILGAAAIVAIALFHVLVSQISLESLEIIGGILVVAMAILGGAALYTDYRRGRSLSYSRDARAAIWLARYQQCRMGMYTVLVILVGIGLDAYLLKGNA